MKKCRIYKGWIYLYINNVNGKMYVGQTIDLHKRKLEHARCKDKNCLLDKAIQKYGIENFTIKILLCFCTTDCKKRTKLLNEKEVYWIDELHTFVAEYPNIGYNKTKGGGGMYGFRHSWAKIHVNDYDSKEEWYKARYQEGKERRQKYKEENWEKVQEQIKRSTKKRAAKKKLYDKIYNQTVRKERESTEEYKLRRKEINKKYRESHKEEIAAKMKAWRDKNKEKMAAQNKLYIQTHWKDEKGHWHKIEIQQDNSI